MTNNQIEEKTLLKSEELTQKGIELVGKIYNKVFCIFSHKDFGYDSDEKKMYEGILISVKFAARKNKLDWVVTVKIGETMCLPVWSEDFFNKVFFDEETAEKNYKKETLLNEQQH